MFISCNKTSITHAVVPVRPPDTIRLTTDDVPANVYICGYNSRSNTNGIVQYWNNGKITSLTDSSKEFFATSISVSGNDVYIAGQENQRENVYARYGKNGAIASLGGTTNFGQATSVFASDGNVYIGVNEANRLPNDSF